MRLCLLLRHALALALLCASGCKLFSSSCGEDDRDCLAPLIGAGLGGECRRHADCKEGLFCEQDECSARGDTARDEACRLTAECREDDYCAGSRVCSLAGVARVDDPCFDNGDCAHGLVCEPPDLSELGRVTLHELAMSSAQCRDGGDREQGEPCDAASDCLAGLYCASLDGGETRCISPPVALPQEPPAIPVLSWEGVECAETGEEDAREAFFEVPGADQGGGDGAGEFYRLPFPNDIRMRGGLDLSDHARPPSGMLPIVGRYLDAVEEDADGFSTNPVAIFRFSHPYDFATVDGDSVRIVDITKDSPSYDQDASIEWKTTEGPLSNYVCPHWLGLRRPPGSPLRSATTYAAIVTTEVVPEDGGSFERGRDFEAMLEESTPGDEALAEAHEAYAPLRAWIEDTGQSPNSILNAAVFTTLDAERVVARLRDEVVADGVPEVSELEECTMAEQATGCSSEETVDGEEQPRGLCHAASDDFTELHARIELPVFQQGSLPYLEPDDGGHFELAGDGTPNVQSHREVCMAISVPTTPAPEEGYPVLVYAHGTGGVFNGQMGALGFAQVAATSSVPAVLIGIDLPMHGERRGDSTQDPDELFFNVRNPRAARDNVAQGSADLMGVVQWVLQGGLTAGDSPLDEDVPFNTSAIGLFGHSQGATHAAVMTSYEPAVTATVLSGVGGHLSSSLLTKQNPVDISAVLPFGLLDPDDGFDLAAGGFNPALAIIQWLFDPVDPVNYARRLHMEPTEAVPSGQHVFMTYGVDDTYSPELTQAAYAKAGRLTHVAPERVDLNLPSAAPPLMGNRDLAGEERTIGLRQYSPSDGVDGHFVSVREGQPGYADVERFLQQALSGAVPQIGE